MRKKRLFALSLMMGLLASFITLQINSASTASVQDAKANTVNQEKSSLTTRPQATLGCSFIDPLDDCIQTRFTQINRVFGLARVYVPYHERNTKLPFSSQPTISGRFVPETDKEKEAVAEIEQSGLKMVIYLASRFILEPAPDESQDKERLFSHQPILGPVAITQSSQKTDWPEALGLWKQTRKAMQYFDVKKSAYHYEFSVGDKDFIARPVRAQESCLKCHNPETYKIYYKYDVSSKGARLGELGVNDQVRQLSVDDPIGVLLYAYNTSTKSNNIKKP